MSVEILKVDAQNPDLRLLERAAAALRQEGVVAYPTETVYGLGADISSQGAVKKVFELKQRVESKPLSVMVSSLASAIELCRSVSEVGRLLMSRYWPGPLTLVFAAAPDVPREVVSAEGKIGVRFPDHPVALALVKLYGHPITCTSANISGKTSAQSAQEVARVLGPNIDLIIDGGICKSNVPSTVVDVSASEARILREGAISTEEITQVIKGVQE